MSVTNSGASSQSSSSFQLPVTDTGSSSGSSSFQYCSLLNPGQAFSGNGVVSLLERRDESRSWRVKVRIQGYDPENGYLCGTLELLDAPMLVAFWEGEIIDNKNYTFSTGKCELSPLNALWHWTQLIAFSHVAPQVKQDGGKSLDLSNYPYIFLRMKLATGGFYYVSFNCKTGFFTGCFANDRLFWRIECWDLQLKTTNDERLGFSFASYELQ